MKGNISILLSFVIHSVKAVEKGGTCAWNCWNAIMICIKVEG